MWTPFLATKDSFQGADTTVTANATANTKGAWTELIASAPFDETAIGLRLGANALSGGDSSAVLDIGIGAAGSEVVVVPDILCGATEITWRILASRIPSGQRISARLQSVIGGQQQLVRAYLFGAARWGQIPAYHAVDALGVITTSDTQSTIVGAVGAGKVEIVASTPHAYKAIGHAFDLGGGTFGGAYSTVSIFVGPAGVEQPLITNLFVASSSSEAISEPFPPNQGFMPLQLDIPAGSRLSVERITGDRSLGIALYGYR